MKKSILICALVLVAGQARSQVKYLSNTFAKDAGESVTSSNGKFLYLSSFHSIIVYEINSAKGTITQKSSIQSPHDEECSTLHLSPDDKYLYTRTSARRGSELVGMIVTYACNAQTGELKFMNSVEQQGSDAFTTLTTIRLSPKGDFLFAVNNSWQDLFVYKRNSSDGSLSFLKKNSINTVMMFSNYVMSSDQKFMYVDCQNRHNDISVLSFDQSTGTVQIIEEKNNQHHVNDYPSKCAISADDKHIYVVGNHYNASTREWNPGINQYSRDTQTGKLTYQKVYSNFNGIDDIDFVYPDGSGENFYMLKAYGTEPHGMFVFKRNPSTGGLTHEKSFFDGGTTNRMKGSYFISFSNDNRYIFLSSTRDHAVNIFENPTAKASINNNSVIVSSGSDSPNDHDDVYTGNSTGSGGMSGGTSGNSGSGQGQSSGTVTSMSKDKFNEAWKKIQAETSDTKKLDLCYELLEGKSISSMQAAMIGMLFSSEYKRLEFVKFASYFVSDKKNFGLLRDLFSYDSLLTDFDKLVKS